MDSYRLLFLICIFAVAIPLFLWYAWPKPSRTARLLVVLCWYVLLLAVFADGLRSPLRSPPSQISELRTATGDTQPNVFIPTANPMTPAAGQVTPTTTPHPPPIVGAENVEAEYPPQMELGHAETIRVSLVYATGLNGTPTVEIAGNNGLRATPISIGTPGPLRSALGHDYHGFIIAHLNAPSFEVKPEATQTYSLDNPQRLDWVWTVLPNKEGTQVLSLGIDVEWVPSNGSRSITYPIYRQRLSSYVNVPIFTWGSPLQLYTIVGAAIGGVVTWVGPKIYARLGKHQKKDKRRNNATPSRQPTSQNRRR